MKSMTAYHHQYINNSISALLQGIGDFFKTELFPRSSKLIISSYEKSVERYTQLLQDPDEKHRISYPFITLEPGYDFKPDDQAGRFFYQYPQFRHKQALNEYKPRIYDDGNIIIAPALNRYVGSLSMIVWCSSIYEMFDYRILAYQFFGGTGRPIEPKNINGQLILPDSFDYYTYENPYTSESYDLSWTGTNVQQDLLIRNINKNKNVFPYVLRPRIILEDVNDGSERYEGSDGLAEWRLNIEMTFECNLPTHLIFYSEALPEIDRIVFSIEVDQIYLRRDIDEVTTVPKNIMATIGDNLTETVQNVDMVLNKTLTYSITAQDITDIQSDTQLTIDLGEDLGDDPVYFKVYGRHGILVMDYYWTVSKTGANTDLIIHSINIGDDAFVEGDTLSIVHYKEDGT